MKPNANFNLVAQYKNKKNSRKADGEILKDNEALGVIELKGTNTKDLEKVREQAFDYKANQTGCVYMEQNEVDGLTNALLKYCELDTLAMVIIFEHFKEDLI